MRKFPKTERLRGRRNFGRVFKEGKVVRSPLAVLYMCPNQNNNRRVGFIVSSKLGKPVVRNKIRRWLTEAYRLNKERLVDGVDMVIIARQAVREADFWAIQGGLLNLFRRAKLLRECGGEDE